ncbi:zinc finger protein VAR3, chloroplastic-like isoform X1 [Cucurbita pepo subsp. pepo]|uniref:zinc finger protein VAR3, chloroplastic-like isoform X1 n=1 Tax=Cucurbita pepo subsp. pepo TaxID=3664 RepID=UPI000C9D6292|nr:zinc finger protein VAR3, chloroplastic-like isoform X1 [Cucurbita pepo subsp. pepo]XP_023529384.1 zinc finger protein VAR3, chloroplastic-like isoform X1 [Cucurbita pepo subsp. pepo]
MSPTKFLHFGTAISRATSRSLSPLLFPRRFFIKCSSSTTLDSAGDDGVDAPQPHSSLIHHPWPEWISFVDGLKTKGYLIEPPSEDANGDGSSSDAVSPSETDYSDMNVLKDACLSFARDRHDILESLSRDDIQTVMKDGCPNLFRKVVNSAKRLRAYVHLDEGEVCSTCNLRGSCDRAYVIMKETEAARTVDIARILLAYALDPLVLSGGDKALGREHVEVSIRKLLSEISELSEEPIEAAAAVKADTKTPSRKEKPSKLTNDALSKDVEMKRGDWMCSKCNFLNFSRNKRCLKCKEEGPKRVGADDIEMKSGDWICPECKFMNFSRNIQCLKCKSKRRKKINNVDEIGMKKGDWICPQCEFMNFASKKECLRCRERRPKRELSPGEWECPSCDFFNYRRNMMCRNCNCERPRQEISAEYQEHLWESPTER